MADKWKPQILQRYVSLINQGIPPQAAFDTAHLSLIEDDWAKNAKDSLTTGRYKNLFNVKDFNQFKQGLRQKNYNTRPAFYNVEIGRGRDKNKQIINQWNKENNISPVAGVYNNINEYS